MFLFFFKWISVLIHTDSFYFRLKTGFQKIIWSSLRRPLREDIFSWYVMLTGLIDRYQQFWGTHCPYFQYFPCKCWYCSTTIHDIVSKKTITSIFNPLPRTKHDPLSCVQPIAWSLYWLHYPDSHRDVANGY